MNRTDQELLEKLSRGDKAALRELFDQYYPYLVSIVLAHTQDLEMAKDVAQEVFIYLWKKREVLSIHTGLKPYLRKAAINRMLNKLKRQRFQVLRNEEVDPSESHFAPETPETPETQLSDKELGNLIQETIDGLPEKCKLVFQLCRVEGLSHKEIAEKLGISTKTIENQMTKALKVLRKAIAQYENSHLRILLFLIFEFI
ncbi:MAG: RNA polymerase sigma-70 factor [Bacteroidota bacterium]